MRAPKGAKERFLWKGTALAVPSVIRRETGFSPEELSQTFYNSFFGNVIKGL
jgi:hypothetical protein